MIPKTSPNAQVTSWGSIFAAVSGTAGSLAPVLPGHFGVAAGIIAGICGVVATRLP